MPLYFPFSGDIQQGFLNKNQPQSFFISGKCIMYGSRLTDVIPPPNLRQSTEE